MRLQAMKAAKKFVDEKFPDCFTALLAGSAARGEDTSTSDLDIVIFDAIRQCYRETFVLYGWKIESFVHNESSYIEQFDVDKQGGRPTLASMIANGFVLQDNGTAVGLKEQANRCIFDGPPPLSEDFIRASRYFIYDLVDDLKDSSRYDESLLTVNTISIQLADFILRLNGKWSGRGKGLARALTAFDVHLSERYFRALEMFYMTGEKQLIIDFVNDIYEPLGGQLFDGFRTGG